MLNNIRIVLIRTSHPGNIGSAARAMKTMGLSDLMLVNPKIFPSATATELAAGADDILCNAKRVGSLEEALADCIMVIGSSARPRGIPTPELTPYQAAATATAASGSGKVAIVLGNEQSGMSNEELLQCHHHVIIPANPEYSSLNLAMAVQVLVYECRMASLGNTGLNLPDRAKYDDLATHQELTGFYQDLENTLKKVNFLRDSNPTKLMPRLKRLFNRVHMEKMEVRILRGILRSIRNFLRVA